MIEGHKRGIRPPLELSLLEQHEFASSIEVRRIFISELDIDIISIHVNSDMNDWQDSPIGRLRVDPLVKESTRDGEVLKVRLYFDEGSELKQKRHNKKRYKELNFREVVVDHRGHGWQELQRDKSQEFINGKIVDVARPKWLHIYASNVWE